MIEEIEDNLQDEYNYLSIEIEKGRNETEFIFYVSVKLTDFKNNDVVKSIRFNFYWNKTLTIETNIRQIKQKINNSIIKFFMKGI